MTLIDNSSNSWKSLDCCNGLEEVDCGADKLGYEFFYVENKILLFVHQLHECRIHVSVF